MNMTPAGMDELNRHLTKSIGSLYFMLFKHCHVWKYNLFLVTNSFFRQFKIFIFFRYFVKDCGLFSTIMRTLGIEYIFLFNNSYIPNNTTQKKFTVSRSNRAQVS